MKAAYTSNWITPQILSVGYVILTIILVVIIALCVILYLLRRSSRVRFTDKTDSLWKHMYHLLYSWASKFMLLRSACPDILIWSPASPPCQPSGWAYWHLWTRTPRWPGCVLFHLNYTNMNRWALSEVCVHCCFCSEPPAEYGHGTTDDLSPPPVVNGTTPQTEENGSNGLSGKTRHAKCGCPTYGQ